MENIKENKRPEEKSSPVVHNLNMVSIKNNDIIK